jgi:hypothetical protein
MYSDWLRAGQPEGVVVLIPVESTIFFVVQTVTGVHPTFSSKDTGGSLPGGKAAGA